MFDDTNMSKNESGTAKPIIKSTLMFFNSKLTDLNDKRLQLNRGKGLAKYLAKSQKNTRDLAPLDAALGVMSFSLYMLRFSANVGLLAHLILVESQEKTNHKIRRDIYYSLLNDSLWCVVNLTQFFWLSYRNSISAGLQGMQLETLAQLIDILVMIIRYQQDKKEYDLKYNQAMGMERSRLAIEWQNKKLNGLRSLLTSLSVVIAFGLFSFSGVAVPLSPVISSIILISSLLRVLIDIEKDRQLIHQLKLNETSREQIKNEQLAMTNARMKDLNKIILNSVFLPIGFFLLITTPIPLTIIACVSMLLVHWLITNLINMRYSPNISVSPTIQTAELSLC
ncbi:lpg0716 family Dot/Icm T4SS effector [Legionella pneumophila]|uniref:lpg0716 family Dot/Icm T4SS effector n=1 Tax=Legionella pneumophila TaxID=446 RepID=UPI0009B329D3|nr:lpg0716 family Dot/Icm T4SS effector [Legionella pneumophila]